MYEYYYQKGVEYFIDGKGEEEHGLVDMDDIDAYKDGWYDAQLNHHTY